MPADEARLNRVLEGEDGWLFLHNDQNGSIEQLTGTRTLTDAGLAAWESVLRATEEWSGARGVVHRSMLVPDKHAVYENKLPEAVARRAVPLAHRSVGRLLSHLGGAGLSTPLYPLAELQDARGPLETFHTTDTHWNAWGQFVGYSALASALSSAGVAMSPVSEEDMWFFLRTRAGDLGAKLSPPRVSRFVLGRPRTLRATRLYDNGVTNNGWVSVYRRSDAEATTQLARCLVFGDSFMRGLQFLLAESFAETTFVHMSHGIDLSVADALQPDVLLGITVERFSIDPPRPGETLRGIVERKLADGETDRPVKGTFPFSDGAARPLGDGLGPRISSDPV